MPRLTRRVPLYRKHRVSGQAVVTPSGVDHYLGPYGAKASKLRVRPSNWRVARKLKGAQPASARADRYRADRPILAIRQGPLREERALHTRHPAHWRYDALCVADAAKRRQAYVLAERLAVRSSAGGCPADMIAELLKEATEMVDHDPTGADSWAT